MERMVLESNFYSPRQFNSSTDGVSFSKSSHLPVKEYVYKPYLKISPKSTYPKGFQIIDYFCKHEIGSESTMPKGVISTKTLSSHLFAMPPLCGQATFPKVGKNSLVVP